MTGILTVDKPEGITSFQAVARIRKFTGEKKCGHTGTLDPMATGVLTIMLGRATSFLNYLPDKDKAYIASIKLGIVTDTLDITGKTLETRSFDVTFDEFSQALNGFKGEIEQLPPMYSAVSVNGKRLYELARQGKEVERPVRKVKIYSADIISSDEKAGEFTFSVECSSGTYIRSLVADIGEKLGCGATLTALKRVKANGFTIDDALTLDEVETLCSSNEISGKLIKLDTIFCDYPEISVSDAQSVRFLNGGFLSAERLKNCKADGLYRIYNGKSDFLGLGSLENGEMKPERIAILP